MSWSGTGESGVEILGDPGGLHLTPSGGASVSAETFRMWLLGL